MIATNEIFSGKFTSDTNVNDINIKQESEINKGNIYKSNYNILRKNIHAFNTNNDEYSLKMKCGAPLKQEDNIKILTEKEFKSEPLFLKIENCIAN